MCIGAEQHLERVPELSSNLRGIHLLREQQGGEAVAQVIRYGRESSRLRCGGEATPPPVSVVVLGPGRPFPRRKDQLGIRWPS
jgi:hypothetical protein